MRIILVTGGAGFVGSNFVRYMLANYSDIQIINLDALTYAGDERNLKSLSSPERYEFMKGDICDKHLLDNLFFENVIDIVVHFAAESHVDRSILSPSEFVRTNIQGTFELLEVAKKYWLSGDNIATKRFHHISTDEVYGTLTPNAPAFNEESPYDPRSPYAASKASSDHLVKAYYHSFGLPITITNCSNNYGPYQFPEKLIPLVIMNCLYGEPIPVYGDGKQIRDWLYVQDHCEAIWQVIESGKIGETYNLGGENQPTNIDIIKIICDLIDEKKPESPNIPHSNLITFVKDRPGHDRRYAMDISKMRTDLQWEPKETLNSGLEKTVQWYLDHQEWLISIIEKDSFIKWVKNNYTERGTE